MLEIHLYGYLKKKKNPKASLAEEMIITLPYKENEDLSSLLRRLEISVEEIGECFINGKVSSKDQQINDGSRIGIFPIGMYLLCGGQHLKGHGFIMKESPKKTNYF